MIDARFKLEMGCPKGVFDRELNAEHEDATFVRTVFRPKDAGLPDKHIIALRPGTAAEWRIFS
jgi:hypothetical protein